VQTEFKIASQDGAEFTVHVNFVCTVIDAITVVKEGQINAADALLAYLKGYQPLFELGLGHPLAEVNALRKEAGHHVKAYMTIKPPQIAGMSIKFANVQVMTPRELADYEEERRKKLREQDLAVLHLDGETALEHRKQEAGLRLEETRQASAREEERRQSLHDHDLAASRQESEAMLRQRELETGLTLEETRLTGTRKIAEVIGADPYEALHHAYMGGGITAAEHAEKLFELTEAKRRTDREDVKEVATRANDNYLRERQWEHDDRRAELEYRRAREEREAAEAREDKRWDRDDRLRREEREAVQERDRRKDQIAVDIELLRELGKRGQLDNYYVDINDLVNRIRGEHGAGQQAAAEVSDASRSALPAGGGDGDGEDDDDHVGGFKNELREEDGD
jgi:hypothetical protein